VSALFLTTALLFRIRRRFAEDANADRNFLGASNEAD
jgi:hypothetical protein